MKKILLTILLTNLVGCGMTEDVTKACRGSMDQLCDMLLGQDPEDIDQLEDEVKNNTDKIEDLDERLFLLENSITLISNRIDAIGFRIIALENSVGNVPTTINPNSLIEITNTLQTQVNNLTMSLANIQLENPVIDYIDPCGDGSGYDEILMKTRNGSYVAYFQQGNGNNQKRFLTLLGDGDFMTTDASACHFTINNGEITWQ